MERPSAWLAITDITATTVTTDITRPDTAAIALTHPSTILLW